MKIYIKTLVLLMLLLVSCKKNQGQYVCKPCNQSCDALSFVDPGTCPHCGMDLIKKSDLKAKENLEVNKVTIQEGSGEFLIEGNESNKSKTIKVFYHKPKNYSSDSKILLVIPGAGRNGDSYRDAWIEESENYSVLILSLMYPEKSYDFGDYHLCGIMYDLDLKNGLTYIKDSNIAELDEDKFTFKTNTNPNDWIFNDFDRVFDLAVKHLNSSQTTYDIFGHSAGGQILHRMAIFNVQSKANHIISANSGFYTLPSFDFKLPFGVQEAPFEEKNFSSIFEKKLILMVGELDNENEKGGTLLHSVSVNKQGMHRLSRGSFFYNTSKAKAESLKTNFNWKLEIVPDTGHDHRKMGDAAGKYLYKNSPQ